ncbi:TPA: hypothetical protein DEF17_06200 [bacterium]|nr:MAG: hypothetical protein AUJ18_07765 [Candidatus Hydrogenedentes bacterium CG1_02_42_14]HBW47508.1 hypothetical protein [bacterium]
MRMNGTRIAMNFIRKSFMRSLIFHKTVIIFLASLPICIFYGNAYAQQKDVRYESIESEIISAMKRLISFEAELKSMNQVAEAHSRELNLAKNSSNPIERIFLPGKIEELHILLEKIEGKEAEIKSLKMQIGRMTDDANKAIEREHLSSEIKDRLDIISRRKLEQLQNLFNESRIKLMKSKNEDERKANEAEVNRLKSELESATAEFKRFYGLN